MNVEKLTEILLKGKKEYKKAVAEYVIWQLQHLNNPELGETTTTEIIDGTIKFEDVWKAIKRKAASHKSGDSACLTFFEVAATACEALHISAAVPEGSAFEYVREMMFNSGNVAVSAPVSAASSTVSLDLDSLFD
ncbi:MAG: hypothetical protein IJY73_06285 [Oscillospiraceae bacterium]|nr:hypothetical protein [Oscillospiraceae bacterium]